MNILRQYVRSGGINAVTGLQMVSLAAPLAMAIADRGIDTGQIAVTSIVICVLWEVFFAFARGSDWSFNGVTTGMLVAIFVSADTPLWHISVGVTLGVVIGELIFGGRGFGFLNAAVVSLAMLIISFPSTSLTPATIDIAVAVAPGLTLLWIAGLVPWRLLLTCLLAILVFALLHTAIIDLVPVLTSLSVGLVFLMADPFASAQSRVGQFLQGLLAAMLIFIFNSGATDISSLSIVQAALLASLLAPLIDQTTIWISSRLRGHSHG